MTEDISLSFSLYIILEKLPYMKYVYTSIQTETVEKKSPCEWCRAESSACEVRKFSAGVYNKEEEE